MPLPKRERCGDCSVLEGQIHEDGCDMERCAFCGHQRISCDCATRHFYPKMRSIYELWVEDETRRELSEMPDPTPAWERMGIPESVYTEGLSDEQGAEWDRIEAEKGRVPFIRYPNICGRCGELWPEMFGVPDEEWNKYVEIFERDKMLCRGCYDQIKGYIDSPGA